MPAFAGHDLQRDLRRALEDRLRRAPAAARGKATRELREAALAELLPLLRPAFAYQAYPVVGATADGLVIGDDHHLASPVVARLFAAAAEVVLLAYTIGPLVEARVAEHRERRDTARSFMLDALGSLAVTELGRLAYGHVKQLATARGLRASIPLNPGTSHWPIAQQVLLLSLIPAADIGLRVTDCYLLSPTKSISMAIALGQDVLTDAEGSSCDYCAQPELCRDGRRRLYAGLA